MSAATLRPPQPKLYQSLRALCSPLGFIQFPLLLLRRLRRLARARGLPSSRLLPLTDAPRRRQVPLDWLQLATLTDLRSW